MKLKCTIFILFIIDLACEVIHYCCQCKTGAGTGFFLMQYRQLYLLNEFFTGCCCNSRLIHSVPDINFIGHNILFPVFHTSVFWNKVEIKGEECNKEVLKDLHLQGNDRLSVAMLLLNDDYIAYNKTGSVGSCD